MGTTLLEKQAHGTELLPRTSRIRGLDTLRGLCVVLMILFHFGYDLYIYCGFSAFALDKPFMVFLQICSSWGFILLAGFSSTLSRSNPKRGLRVVLCGVAVSAVTALWGDPIHFGILSFLGWAMILYGLTGRFWEKTPHQAAIIIYIIFFMLTKAFFPRPTGLSFLYPLGFYGPGFRSSDYWPLLPWFFLFLTGTGLGRYRDRVPEAFRAFCVPGLDWLGRHSLLVYLAHQPVLVGLSMGIARLTGHGFSV